MGVHVGDATGDHIATLLCRNCESRYETDETMPNDCPTCGVTSFDIVDSEASDR